MSSNVIVLSAGGTGGHLFPAQALAGVLARRGRGVVVMTDTRFANYATAFPGAQIQTVPSAPLNAITAPFKIMAGIAIAFAKLLKLKPAAVVGFGGYPSVPVMLAASLARLPTAQLRALFPNAAAFVDTERGPATPTRLRQLLSDVRNRGYATEEGSVTSGLSSVAQAVLDHAGHPTAAVAATYVAGEVDHQNEARLIEAVNGAAAQLSRRLGFRAVPANP